MAIELLYYFNVLRPKMQKALVACCTPSPPLPPLLIRIFGGLTISFTARRMSDEIFGYMMEMLHHLQARDSSAIQLREYISLMLSILIANSTQKQQGDEKDKTKNKENENKKGKEKDVVMITDDNNEAVRSQQVGEEEEEEEGRGGGGRALHGGDVKSPVDRRWDWLKDTHRAQLVALAIANNLHHLKEPSDALASLAPALQQLLKMDEETEEAYFSHHDTTRQRPTARSAAAAASIEVRAQVVRFLELCVAHKGLALPGSLLDELPKNMAALQTLSLAWREQAVRTTNATASSAGWGLGAGLLAKSSPLVSNLATYLNHRLLKHQGLYLYMVSFFLLYSSYMSPFITSYIACQQHLSHFTFNNMQPARMCGWRCCR